MFFDRLTQVGNLLSIRDPKSLHQNLSFLGAKRRMISHHKSNIFMARFFASKDRPK